MAIKIEIPPQLSGAADEKLRQVYSYLYRLSEALNVALGELDTPKASVKPAVAAATQKAPAGGSESVYNELRALIINTANTITVVEDRLTESISISVSAAEDRMEENTSTAILAAESRMNIAVSAAEGRMETAISESEGRTGTAISSAVSAAEGRMENSVALAENRLIETFRSRLTALSDRFGSFAENIEQQISATATGVVQSFNYDALLSSLETYRVHTEGFIRTGFIDYDGNGVPIIGIAIGQNLSSQEIIINGETYTQFDASQSCAFYTADRVSFRTNGQEVAYISNNKMYITQAQIADSFTLGNWQISKAGGLSIKWIGG